MNIRKKTLDWMERCCVAAGLNVGGRLYAVLASDVPGGPCYAYTGKNFDEREVIWNSPGGAVSLRQIIGAAGLGGDFLAIQNFFPGLRGEKAKLVWGRRGPDGWIVEDLAALPFIHRFDMFEVHGQTYILACTLCGSKKDEDDWSDPGKVFIGRLPASPGEKVDFVPITGNFYKNHGYCRGVFEGHEAGFITHNSGVCAIMPPREPGGRWVFCQVLDDPIADIAVCDLDSDGEHELVTVEPFHRDSFLVRKRQGGGYKEIYRVRENTEIAYAVAACTLRGKPAVLCGTCRCGGELFILTRGSGSDWCDVTSVDSGVGPSNIAVINTPERDIIISANYTKNEAALYFVTD